MQRHEGRPRIGKSRRMRYHQMSTVLPFLCRLEANDGRYTTYRSCETSLNSPSRPGETCALRPANKQNCPTVDPNLHPVSAYITHAPGLSEASR